MKSTTPLAPLFRACGRAAAIGVGPLGLLVILLFHATPALSAASGSVLRVGTSGDYPPFSEAISRVPTPLPLLEGSDITIPRDLPTQVAPQLDGPLAEPTYRGLDIEVAKRFAADTGRTLEFMPFRWPDLGRQLANESFHVAMSGITLRPERAATGLQSRPYLVTSAVTVVREGDSARFRDPAWLDAPEVRIAVNRGGYLERIARREFLTAQIIPIDDNRQLPSLLAMRKVEAVIAERFEALTWKQQGLHVGASLTHDTKGYLAPAGSLDLITQLDDWLAARERDGWLERLRVKWLGGQAASTPRDLCGEALASRIANREALMPQIAAAKQELGLAIEDPSQEARVIARALKRAKDKKLEPESVAVLFSALMQSAKASQLASLLGPRDGSRQPTLSLERLRAAVADASTQLIDELDRCQPHLAEVAKDTRFRSPERQPELEARIWGAIRQIRRVSADAAN